MWVQGAENTASSAEKPAPAAGGPPVGAGSHLHGPAASWAAWWPGPQGWSLEDQRAAAHAARPQGVPRPLRPPEVITRLPAGSGRSPRQEHKQVRRAPTTGHGDICLSYPSELGTPLKSQVTRLKARTGEARRAQRKPARGPRRPAAPRATSGAPGASGRAAGRLPTCSSLSEYFCGFLLPWLFLRSFFSSAWHLSSASPLLLCSVWYFFSAA